MKPLNIKQDHRQVILDRFNAKNALQLKYQDFIFDDPITVDAITHNTEILVRPKLDSKGYNSFKIFYNKMDLSEVLDRSHFRIDTQELTTVVEILDFINDTFGIYLTSDDIINHPIEYEDPTDKKLRASVLVEAKPTSLLFKGSFKLLLNVTVKPFDTQTKKPLHILIASNNQVEAINSDMSFIPYFKFLNNVTNKTYEIKKSYLLKEGWYLVGNFQLEGIPDIDNQSYTDGLYKGVLINSKGDLIGLDHVARFDDNTDESIYFTTNLDQTFYYQADKAKVIQTHGNGLYRYYTNGVRDTTLNIQNLVEKIDKVLPLSDGKMIICSDLNTVQNNYITIKRLNPNGSIDETFNTIQIKDSNSYPIYVDDICYSKNTDNEVDGFYIAIYTNIKDSLHLTINNTNITQHLTDLPNIRYESNIIKFNLDGSLNTSFKYHYDYLDHRYFTKILENNSYRKLFSIKDDGCIYFTKGIHPYKKIDSLFIHRLDKDGNIQWIDLTSYNKLLPITKVINIQEVEDSFIVGVKASIVNNITVEEKDLIYAFDTNGLLIATYYLPDDFSLLTFGVIN